VSVARLGPFSQVEGLDAPLFPALARSAEGRVADFGAADLATIAWAFANAGQLDGGLFAALARCAERGLARVHPT